MKKVLMLSLLIICVIVTGCTNNNSDVDVNYKEDLEHQISSNYTYRFIGESDHFYFETGKVYYNNTERELLISNFKVKNNIDKNAKFSINLYFNDKILYGDVYNSNNLLSKEELENTIIGEHGYLGDYDQNGNIIGESDSFLETTKENFKDSIRLDIKYCVKSKCETETLKLKYLDND